MSEKYCVALDIAEEMHEESLEYGVHYLMVGGAGATLKEMRHFEWEPILFNSIDEAKSAMLELGTEWKCTNILDTIKIELWNREQFENIPKSTLMDSINSKTPI